MQRDEFHRWVFRFTADGCKADVRSTWVYAGTLEKSTLGEDTESKREVNELNK